MIWLAIVILVVLWAVGALANVAGGLIHILLVIALVALVFNLFIANRDS